MGCVFEFFIIVVVFSVSEVAVLLWAAQHTGLLFTIACCAFTGLLGGYLVKKQGLITLRKIQTSLSQGVIPATEAVEALLLLIVGVLLCVPGFITDTIGFLIVIPFIRKPVAQALINHFSKLIKEGKVAVYTSSEIYSGSSTNYNDSNDEINSLKGETSVRIKHENEIEDAEIIDD